MVDGELGQRLHTLLYASKVQKTTKEPETEATKINERFWDLCRREIRYIYGRFHRKPSIVNGVKSQKLRQLRWKFQMRTFLSFT